MTICTRDVLPVGEIRCGDVTFEALWWWGRLSRWDIASRLTVGLDPRVGNGLMQDLRLETLVEVCRWDLLLAEEIMSCWDGEPESLPEVIAASGARKDRTSAGYQSVEKIPTGVTSDWPHESALEPWDDGTVNLWQGEFSLSAASHLFTDAHVRRSIWLAQTRVLFPWIETRRHELASHLLRKRGRAAVNRFLVGAGLTGDNWSAATLEVGPLAVAIAHLVGSQDPQLRQAALLLKQARNRLAHLDILTGEEQRVLVETVTHIAARPDIG